MGQGSPSKIKPTAEESPVKMEPSTAPASPTTPQKADVAPSRPAADPEAATKKLQAATQRQATCVYRTEAAINENRTHALAARSLVQENAVLIAKNYTSAFNGNRQLTLQNTDDLFRNRLAILGMWAASAASPVEAAYAEAIIHKEKIAFLRQRARLNQQVLEITLSMAGVNSKSLEVNKLVMRINEEIVVFNHNYIEENTEWLAGDTPTAPDAAGMDAAMKLVRENADTIRGMEKRAAGNSMTLVVVGAALEKNREAIQADEKTIKERREQIRANRAHIHTNQAVVKTQLGAATASGAAGATEGGAGLGAQSTQALETARAEIFALEAEVYETYSSAYEARSLVQENAALIAKNYTSAFNGNRQLANQNTEDLFRNRLAILGTRVAACSSSDAGAVAHAKATLHKHKIAFLQHLGGLNQQVLEVTLNMSGVNTAMLDVNKRVMETNEEIVEYNTSYIAENTEWLASGPRLSVATAELVEELIAANAAAVVELHASTTADKARVTACLEAAQLNSNAIATDSTLVQERAKNIQMNRDQIVENQHAVSSLLDSTVMWKYA